MLKSLNNLKNGIRNKASSKFENFRDRLAYIDALPQLTALGLVSGIIAACIIVLFRLLIDFGQRFFLSIDQDNFEQLDAAWRFGLPAIGAIVIGICFHFLNKDDRNISVSHVLDRLHNHQGQLPFKNFIVQFFGGAASLITGQSVGREGPAVHLGAGAASLLGQWLKLPNNSLRTLVGCGVAAAISASFNTPIAGVIFAMEVVLMEYTIAGFIPVILASVSGAIISQVVFPDALAFSIKSVQMNSLLEIPFMVCAGFVIGCVAASFIHLQLYVGRFQKYPIIARFAFIGVITGGTAVFVPSIMGLGYDTLDAAMIGDLSIRVLLVLIIAKLVVTGISTGLGMPGGAIGPILLIGGCIGGLMGIVGNIYGPEQASSPGFYVTLGMAAMMGATLNAPLAALMAVLELTYNPNVIFPSMVVIVVACIVVQQFFGCQGLFITQLKAAGTPIHSEPARQVLSRVGVRGVMTNNFVTSEKDISLEKAKQLLLNQPPWIIIQSDSEENYLLRASDLAQHLEALQEEQGDTKDQQSLETPMIDLRKIPGKRFKMLGIHQRTNLFEARRQLLQSNCEVICVERPDPYKKGVAVGIVTPEHIESYYST
ncbi:chloride channel protein [Aurantivibrio infirmus]